MAVNILAKNNYRINQNTTITKSNLVQNENTTKQNVYSALNKDTIALMEELTNLQNLISNIPVPNLKQISSNGTINTDTFKNLDTAVNKLLSKLDFSSVPTDDRNKIISSISTVDSYFETAKNAVTSEILDREKEEDEIENKFQVGISNDDYTYTLGTQVFYFGENDKRNRVNQYSEKYDSQIKEQYYGAGIISRDDGSCEIHYDDFSNNKPANGEVVVIAPIKNNTYSIQYYKLKYDDDQEEPTILNQFDYEIKEK